MRVNEERYQNVKKYIDDILTDKTKNTLGDWIADYGGTVNDNLTITFGSHYALQKMLDRRDKEVIRIVLEKVIEEYE